MRKNAPTGVCKSASTLRTTARRYRAAMTTDAALRRLRLQAGDVVSAREAFAQAAANAHTIAAHTSDESLRATFLDSSAVREVLDWAAEAKAF